MNTEASWHKLILPIVDDVNVGFLESCCKIGINIMQAVLKRGFTYIKHCKFSKYLMFKTPPPFQIRFERITITIISTMSPSTQQGDL